VPARDGAGFLGIWRAGSPPRSPDSTVITILHDAFGVTADLVQVWDSAAQGRSYGEGSIYAGLGRRLVHPWRLPDRGGS